MWNNSNNRTPSNNQDLNHCLNRRIPFTANVNAYSATSLSAMSNQLNTTENAIMDHLQNYHVSYPPAVVLPPISSLLVSSFRTPTTNPIVPVQSTAAVSFVGTSSNYYPLMNSSTVMTSAAPPRTLHEATWPITKWPTQIASPPVASASVAPSPITGIVTKSNQSLPSLRDSQLEPPTYESPTAWCSNVTLPPGLTRSDVERMRSNARRAARRLDPAVRAHENALRTARRRNPMVREYERLQRAARRMTDGPEKEATIAEATRIREIIRHRRNTTS